MLPPIRSPRAFVVTAVLLGVSLRPAAVAADGQIVLPAGGSETVALDAGTAAPWQDREFRVTYVEEVDETHMFLALQPIDIAANEPRVTLVFGARFRGRTPRVAPADIEVRVALHPNYDPLLERSPSLTLVMDPDTEDRRQLDLTGFFLTAGYIVNAAGPRQPGFLPGTDPFDPGPLAEPPPEPPDVGPVVGEGPVSSSVDAVLFTLPVGIPLLRILNAERVEGTAIGAFAFRLSDAQLEAFKDYANRVLVTGDERTRQAATAQRRRIRPPGPLVSSR